MREDENGIGVKVSGWAVWCFLFAVFVCFLVLGSIVFVGGFECVLGPQGAYLGFSRICMTAGGGAVAVGAKAAKKIVAFNRRVRRL